MPRKNVQDGQEVMGVQAEFADSTPIVEAQLSVEWKAVEEETEAPRPRIVKLANATTMYLIEDGIRYPITNSGAAAALNLHVEVVSEDDLLAWPEGDLYTGQTI